MIISENLFHQIGIVTQKVQISRDAFFFSAFIIFLAKMTGQTEILLTKSVSPRIRKEYQPIFGALINFIVFRASILGEMLIHEFLLETYKRLFADYLHAQFPYREIKKVLQDKEGVENFFFNYHIPSRFNMEQTKCRVQDISVQSLHATSEGAMRDIRLEVFESADQFHLSFLADVRRFPMVMDMFETQFSVILSCLTRDLECTLDTILV